MVALPQSLYSDPTLDAADAALVERQDRTPRPYYGMSTAGLSCARRRWLAFRWAGQEQLTAQSLRAIEDGHRGEALQAARLRLVPGVELITEQDGRQIAVEAVDGHMRGHLDGAIRGLLQAPKTWCVWEHKQVNEKKHAALHKAKDTHGEKDALEAWDATYFAQAQCYMRYTGMERHYLTAATPGGRATISVRTEYQADKAARIEADARAVIYAAEPPPRISEDASWYECKFCPFHAQCHGEARPEVTCRSCAHSTPVAGGAWHCARFDADIPVYAQREGCADHRYIPSLLDRVAELVESDECGDRVQWRNRLTGKTFGQPDYDSRELHDASDFRNIGDDITQAFKAHFGARVVPNDGGPAPGEDGDMTWQTFKDGSRHIRREHKGKFLGYLKKTPERLAKLEALGNPAYHGDSEFLDDGQLFYDAH